MKKFFGIILALGILLGVGVSGAAGAKVYDGRTFDAKDPWWYHNESGDCRIFTSASITGYSPNAHYYDKRLMLSADGVNWYQTGIVQTRYVPAGNANVADYDFWSGPPAIDTNPMLYIVQVKPQGWAWADADRSAGKWITCRDL